MVKPKYTVLVEDYNVPLHPWIFWNEIFGPINYELTGRGIYIDNLYVFEKEKVTWGPIHERFAGSGNYFEKQMNNDNKFVSRIVSNQLASFRKINIFANKLLVADLRGLSNKKLFAWYDEFHKLWVDCGRLAGIPPYMDMSDDKLSDRVKISLEKYLRDKNDLETIFSKLTTSLGDTYLYKEQIAVLNCLVNWKKSSDIWKIFVKSKKIDNLPKEIIKDLNNLAKKFGWMQFYYDGQAAKADYYYDLVKRHKKNPEKELLSKKNEKVILKKWQAKIMSGLSRDLIKQINALKDFSYIKELRKEVQIYRLNFAMQKWFQEAARRLYCTATLVKYLFPDEIELWLKKGNVPSVEELNKRYNCLAVLQVNGKETFCTGAKAMKFKELFFPIDTKISGDKELKGNTAYPGKIKGIVKIVNAKSDLEKFQEGDILVSFSTNPSLVPAMNKAAAIITNTGGVTCHAAIVARELKTPCIIGTKIATKVLHDGDLVEVDANRGIIRIIERTKN
ncbi:MAG: PEP-utilizing enzyme [Patescibacteria group bacterium]